MDHGFLFGGFSPPNKEVIPLRPLSLCGEISIFADSDHLYHFQTEPRKTASSKGRKLLPL
jgi:hypothetical protein